MAKHVKRSVIPIYLVGVVWLVFGLGLRLYQPVDYILCALVSVAAFVVGKAIFPDKSYQIAGGEDEEEKKQAEQEAQKRAEEAHAAREKAQAEREERQRREQEEKARQAQQAKSTGNPEIDKLILERERALSEMRRLNDSIEDETISAQIDHLEEVTRKIIDQVIQDPKKLPQIRRFLNYFLPTTLKILNAYDRMDAVGISLPLWGGGHGHLHRHHRYGEPAGPGGAERTGAAQDLRGRNHLRAVRRRFYGCPGSGIPKARPAHPPSLGADKRVSGWVGLGVAAQSGGAFCISPYPAAHAGPVCGARAVPLGPLWKERKPQRTAAPCGLLDRDPGIDLQPGTGDIPDRGVACPGFLPGCGIDKLVSFFLLFTEFKELAGGRRP